MNRSKAHALIDTIIDANVAAVGASDGRPDRIRDALNNARTDLYGLVDEIYADVAGQVEEFEEHVETALGIQVGDGESSQVFGNFTANNTQVNNFDAES